MLIAPSRTLRHDEIAPGSAYAYGGVLRASFLEIRVLVSQIAVSRMGLRLCVLPSS